MAAKKKKPLSAYGVDLSAPALAPAVPIDGDAKSISAALQASQNTANAANQQRYNQGLGVLTGGVNTASGFIQQALDNSAGVERGAYKRVEQQYKNDIGKTEQQAINRGLGNTTIRNALLDMDKRRFNDANQDIDAQGAARISNLNLQQASNARTGAGDIASFIAARNDMGPDVGLYAQLIQNAAAANDAKGVTRTGTVMGGKSFVEAPRITSGSSGNSFGSNAMGSGLASYLGGSGGGGGGSSRPSLPSPVSGYQPPNPIGAPIQAAIAPSQQPQSSGPSDVMTKAGYAPGSISITPTKKKDPCANAGPLERIWKNC